MKVGYHASRRPLKKLLGGLCLADQTEHALWYLRDAVHLKALRNGYLYTFGINPQAKLIDVTDIFSGVQNAYESFWKKEKIEPGSMYSYIDSTSVREYIRNEGYHGVFYEDEAPHSMKSRPIRHNTLCILDPSIVSPIQIEFVDNLEPLTLYS